jgi:hypothetical protein
MTQALPFSVDLINDSLGGESTLNVQLPDPADPQVPEADFLRQVNTAWQVCDRFDLQTDIWRGRILRAVRDREKLNGNGRGTGFLNWLKEQEISKTQAYSWIELADSADMLLAEGHLDAASVHQFSKRAFIETAQAAPEVQQMVTESARKGDRITRREVQQLADEWTAMTSELLPEVVKEKAASNTLPPKYLAPLVREMEKLPASHQQELQQAIAESPDVDTLKQVTTEARYLAKYLESAAHVQALSEGSFDLEIALEEALRVGCLTSAAEVVNQAAQLEQMIAKLHLTWKRLNVLVDRLYVDTGASTPELRTLLSCMNRLAGEVMEVEIGGMHNGSRSQVIRLQILSADEGKSELVDF